MWDTDMQHYELYPSQLHPLDPEPVLTQYTIRMNKVQTPLGPSIKRVERRTENFVLNCAFTGGPSHAQGKSSGRLLLHRGAAAP